MILCALKELIAHLTRQLQASRGRSDPIAAPARAPCRRIAQHTWRRRLLVAACSDAMHGCSSALLNHRRRARALSKPTIFNVRIGRRRVALEQRLDALARRVELERDGARHLDSDGDARQGDRRRRGVVGEHLCVEAVRRPKFDSTRVSTSEWMLAPNVA